MRPLQKTLVPTDLLPLGSRAARPPGSVAPRLMRHSRCPAPVIGERTSAGAVPAVPTAAPVQAHGDAAHMNRPSRTLHQPSPSEPMKRNVFVVDDHPIMRRGYASLVNAQPDLQTCGDAGSASEALDGVGETDPDLVIADISLTGTNGIELTKQLLSQRPDLPILIISMHDEALYAERALEAGAHGYLMKLEGDEAVLNAIRSVLDGHVYLSQAMQDRLLFQHVGHQKRTAGGTAPTAIETLSDRELEVFEMVGRGHSTGEVAQRLTISPKTVESHRSRIKAKLGIDTSIELLRHAMQWVERIGDHTPSPHRDL